MAKDEPKQNRQSTSAAPEHSRRKFLKLSTALTALSFVPIELVHAAKKDLDNIADRFEQQQLQVEINGKAYTLSVEPRTTVLDLLREDLHLTGTKKGCDWGQCGACTVHINGRRALACMSLAIMQNGKKITTIEALSDNDILHPMQQAFIKHDGFQCGYCTPGQIMSAISCIHEGHANSEDEIREYMSGNICRCGAYCNITDAILEVKKGGKQL